MALVNHTLDNIVQGVTQQYQEGRYETQVEEMVNCMPSLSRGILRRNPIIENTNLYLPGFTDLTNNPFTYVFKSNIEDKTYVLILPGDGYWYVKDIDDPHHSYLIWYGLDAPYLVATNPKQSFKVLTLGNQTFIVNSEHETRRLYVGNDLPVEQYTDYAFYWIKQTTQVVTAQRTIDTDSGTRLEGYTYSIRATGSDADAVISVAAVKDTRPGESDPDLITADKIAQAIAIEGDTQSGTNYWLYDGSFVAQNRPHKYRWLGGDTNGDTASLAVHRTVENASDLPYSLPSTLFNGFIVRVTGMAGSNLDDYYLQYIPNEGWVECASPNIPKGLNTYYLPHVLYETLEPIDSKDHFILTEYQETDNLGKPNGVSAWQERTVGDLRTNPDPLFTGKPITNIFFYKNRLGFISEDTITLSRVGEYGGFYLDTVQTVKDDGPINIYIATPEFNRLRHAVPTANTLLLFGDKSQFILQSGSQPLTPLTATINRLSTYDYSYLADAKANRNNILFTSDVGGYTQLLEMNIEDTLSTASVQAEASTLTEHTPSYIPKNVQQIVSDISTGYTFLHSNEEINALTVITSKEVGNKRVQLAVHKWVFDFDIVGVHVANSKLYLITPAKTVATMNLEIPGEIDNIEYWDKQPTGDYNDFISGIWFSNFYFRDQRGLGSNRGRFQVRTLLYDSLGSYMTTITALNKYTHTQPDCCYYPNWNDNLTWIDDNIWIDEQIVYNTQYYNDKLVTIMQDNENVKIVFSNNEEEPTKGFELHTVNVEALYYQRSRRT